MKRIFIFVAFVLVNGGLLWALPSPGSFGLGVIVGEPFGPTVKYWTNSNQALQFGIGFDDDPIFYGDFLIQGWNLVKGSSAKGLGGYLGLGPRYEQEDHADDKFGVRFVGGLNYFFDQYPVELFGELAPVFQVSPDTDSDLDAGVGVRYYFGK